MFGFTDFQMLKSDLTQTAYRNVNPQEQLSGSFMACQSIYVKWSMLVKIAESISRNEYQVKLNFASIEFERSSFSHGRLTPRIERTTTGWQLQL